MDIFILDEILRRETLIDQYVSFIWTDRYAEWGDFELVVEATRGNRALFREGTCLAIHQSKKFMIVDTLIDTVSDEGEALLTITGKSGEVLLEDRAVMKVRNGNEFESEMNYTGKPADIVRTIFDQFCATGMLGGDALPFYTAGTIYPVGNILEPQEVVTIKVEPGSAYEVIKKICDVYNLGFRLVRNGDSSELYFDVYTGTTRTTTQTIVDPVVFSPELDNLSDISSLTSIEGFKNVAYVDAVDSMVVVYAEGVDETVDGFNRRVLYVDGTGVANDVEPAYTNSLKQLGYEALAEQRVILAFDGEIPQFGSYSYEEDYWLGDIVETRKSDGTANNMRVTEQIFVSDDEGDRAYPTLSFNQLITPGSWFGWPTGQVWLNADGYWADV